MKAYRITHWNQHETYEGRKLAQLHWYAKPNNQQSLSYRRLVKQPDAAALYGAWCAILDVASSGDRAERGWLVRKGKPLDPMDLEVLTGFPEGLFEQALSFLSGPKMNWLTEADFPGAPADPQHVPSEAPAGPAGKKPTPPGTAGKPPAHSTVEESTEEKSPTDKNIARAGNARGGDGLAAKVQAARTQWAALTRQIKELDARGEDLTPEERRELQQKRAALTALEKREANGEF